MSHAGVITRAKTVKQHKFGTDGKVMWLEHRQDWQEGDEVWNGRHR